MILSSLPATPLPASLGTRLQRKHIRSQIKASVFKSSPYQERSNTIFLRIARVFIQLLKCVNSDNFLP